MLFNPRRASSGNGAFLISSARSRSSMKMDSGLPPRPRNPALLRVHKFRVVVLPVLLVVAFATLILSAIYAYCVAKPHSNIPNQLETNSISGPDSSLFGRRDTITNANVKRSTSTDGTSELALLFYTLTVPGLTIFYLVFELIMHNQTPQHLSLRSIYTTLIAMSSLLICGWITTVAFWMHCELPIFNQNKTGQSVCPIQVRGHFMYGIHEVSITRVVMGWMIVLAYMLHVTVLVLGYRAQKRIWRICGGNTKEDLERTHGEARIVVVKFEDDDHDHDQLRKEANVV